MHAYLLLALFIIARSVLTDNFGAIDKVPCICASSISRLLNIFASMSIQLTLVSSDLKLDAIESIAAVSNSGAIILDISMCNFSSYCERSRLSKCLDIAARSGRQDSSGYYGTVLFFSDSTIPAELFPRVYPIYLQDISFDDIYLANSIIQVFFPDPSDFRTAIDFARAYDVSELSDTGKQLAYAALLLQPQASGRNASSILPQLLDAVKSIDEKAEASVHPINAADFWAWLLNYISKELEAKRCRSVLLPAVNKEDLSDIDHVIFWEGSDVYLSTNFFEGAFVDFTPRVPLSLVKQSLSAEGLLDTDSDGKHRSWMSYDTEDGAHNRIRMKHLLSNKAHFSRLESLVSIITRRKNI